MLDQSFSVHNLETIYNLESRKGNIDISTMPTDYQQVVTDVERTRKRLLELKCKTAKTRDEIIEEEELKLSLHENLKKKQEILSQWLGDVSREINASTFRFVLDKFTEANGKEVFTLAHSDMTHFFASKQLQYNIRKTYKVKQANRHFILSNIKIFLNSSIPVYIIRTDISSFYESIPQEKLFELLMGNTLLSNKSKAFIKGIFAEYERIKDISLVPAGLGVPRGVGISSYLSELYMRDIDEQIAGRREVLLYARYVDDVFIILTTLNGKTMDEYYSDLVDKFAQKGLCLKPKTDSSGKCQLLDFYTKDEFVPRMPLNYIGYDLKMSRHAKILYVQFALSDSKKQRIRERIDHAISHFETYSKCNIKQAYRDLFDSLNVITGNYKLFKTKSNVKVGLYYNNDLLDEKGDLQELTVYLHSKTIKPYAGLKDAAEVERCIMKRVQRIDFEQRWKDRKMYIIPLSRLQEINEWL